METKTPIRRIKSTRSSKPNSFDVLDLYTDNRPTREPVEYDTKAEYKIEKEKKKAPRTPKVKPNIRSQIDTPVLNEFFYKKYGFYPNVPADKEYDFYQKMRAEYMKANPNLQRKITLKKRFARIKESKEIAESFTQKEKVSKEVGERNRNNKQYQKPCLMNLRVVMVLIGKDNKEFEKVINVNGIETTKATAPTDAKEEVDDIKRMYEMDSPTIGAKCKGYTYELIEIKKEPTPLTKVKVKDAHALLIDGDDPQPWDRKKGTCVHDFIIYRYKDHKGFKQNIQGG